MSVDKNLANRVQLISDAPSGKIPDDYTEKLLVNNNRIYDLGSPLLDDPWIDLRLFARPTSPASHTYEFDLKDISEPGGFLNLNFWGVTNFPDNPDHHIIFELNGIKILEEIFDGTIVFNSDIDLSKKGVKLKEFFNQLKITLPGDTGAAADIVNFNSFNLRYSRNFVATDGVLTFEEKGPSFLVHQLESPNIIVYKLNGTEVFRYSLVDINASNGLYNAKFAGDSKEIFKYAVFEEDSIINPDVQILSENNSINSGTAEYLIISHPDFVEDISVLINERSKDFSTKLVTSDVIYDNYNFGIFDPKPIKDYIKFAHENLGTEYVLLVGGDSYDYKNYLGLGSLSFIPTVYFSIHNSVSFAPSDSLLADTNGDNVQDLAIGRLPARKSSELSNIIDKILEYPAMASRKNAVFAADDAEGNNSFSNQSDGLIDLLPEGWNVDRAYIDELGVAKARKKLITSINEGRALTSFFGHSGFTVWTGDGLFKASDVSLLTNDGSPTIVTQLGCWNTYFVDPRAKTLSHKFLLSGKNGAAAVAGPTTLTEVDSDRIIGGLILEKMFEGYTIGKALMEAKQEISSNNQFRIDIIAGWNLLGDPALSFLP